MIPQSFIQDLLARVDIVDVVERYLPLKKSGANYFACCPFHSEKSASFSVSPAKQFYYCFGCGAHGNAIGFLMEYNGISYPEAIEELARIVGVPVPSDGRRGAARTDERQQLLDAMDRAAKFYRDALKTAPAAVAYLRQRGLSDEIAARFCIGYAPSEQQALRRAFSDYTAKYLVGAGLAKDGDDGKRRDFFFHRIMFPIHDRQGRAIAFGGRVLDDGKPKYLNTPQTLLFEKGRELYGFFLAQKAIRAAGFAFVVEGYMDVVALAQFGLENAVAPLGTATTPHHIQSLLKQTDRVVFCFDGDEAGRHAAWRALENALAALRDDVTLAFLFLPPEHDPDTFVRENGADVLRTAAARATPLADFLLDNLKQRCNFASAEGRARLIHEARPLIVRIPEAAAILRLQLIKAIASASHLTQSEAEHAFGMASSSHAHAQFQFQSENAARAGVRRPPARRPPPSAISTLLRLVLQYPALAARLPIGLVSDDTAEGRALIAIIDLASLGEPLGGFGALLERFRETPCGDTLARVATEFLDTEFDPTVIERQFEDTLLGLQIDANEQEQSMLQKRVATLPGDEQLHLARRLAELLREKEALRRKRNTLGAFTPPGDS
ncbi:MAG: DNA primase [Azoarcus sp.]|jgi:DNA primase|nr:DNA primase [Azoarcus sp.]